MALDPSSIPASNDYLFLMYDENDISTAFDFYGKPAEDDYEGHKSYTPPLLNYTLGSLKLEYGGYKTYIANRKNKVKGKLELKLKSFNEKLICANAPKYKPTWEITAIQREIVETFACTIWTLREKEISFCDTLLMCENHSLYIKYFN